MLTRKLNATILLLTVIAVSCSDSGDPLEDSTPVLPTLSVNNVAVAEGQTADFTVTLSMAATQDVTFSWATAAGTASSDDFTTGSGSDTIIAGATTATISVATVQDDDPETSETFSLVLSGASVSFTDSVGQCTINDDDVVTPSMFVSDVTVNEGDPAVFTVSLSSAAVANVNFTYSTADGSAASPDDYTATSGSGMIPSGGIATLVSVPTIDDGEVESDETFNLILATNDAPFLDSVGVGTIQSDDILATVSYQTDVRPIFQNNSCTAPNCHGSGAVGNGFLMGPTADWNMVRFGTGFGGRAVVVPGDAASSPLYLATTTNLPSNVAFRMPRLQPALSTAEMNLIRDWINEGALDN